MTPTDKSPRSLLCPYCNQDHAQDMERWCEVSDLQIKYLAVKQELGAARAENQLLAHAASAEANEHDSLRTQLADVKAELGRLKQTYNSVFDDRENAKAQIKKLEAEVLQYTSALAYSTDPNK